MLGIWLEHTGDLKAEVIQKSPIREEAEDEIWVKSSTETPISMSTPKGQNGDSAKPGQNSRSKNKTRNPKPKSHYIARPCLKQNKTKISKQNPLGTATQSKRKAE